MCCVAIHHDVKCVTPVHYDVMGVVSSCSIQRAIRRKMSHDIKIQVHRLSIILWPVVAMLIRLIVSLLIVA